MLKIVADISKTKNPKKQKIVEKMQVVAQRLKTNSIPLPSVIRPSHVKEFGGCAEKYRLKYIEKISEPPSEALFQGSIQDAACSRVMTLIMQGRTDLSMETFIQEALFAAEESYRNLAAGFAENVPKWLMKKGFKDYAFLIESPVFPEWINVHLDSQIEGVQVPLSFEYITKDGEIITISGTADQVLKDAIVDQKTSGQTVWHKKKDKETGQWLFNKDNEPILVSSISPEYRIQGSCYMRAANKNKTILDYFIKTKMPKFERVIIPRTERSDYMLDSYLERFVDAHYYNNFNANIYYEWCGICSFHGNLCKATSREVME